MWHRQCQPRLHCSAQALPSSGLPSHLSCPRDSATPVHGGQGAVRLGSDPHNTYRSPWQSQDLASSNQNGPHSRLEQLFKIYWCQVATEATVAGGVQSGIRDPLSSNLLPASNRAATVPRQAPARLQDWVCWV